MTQINADKVTDKISDCLIINKTYVPSIANKQIFVLFGKKQAGTSNGVETNPTAKYQAHAR